MDLKEFFYPKWQKFVLPLILIVIFFYFIFQFHQEGELNDRYLCDVKESISILKNISQHGAYNLSDGSIVINQTNKTISVSEIRKLDNSMAVYFSKENFEALTSMHQQAELFLLADPLLPLPCDTFTKEIYAPDSSGLTSIKTGKFIFPYNCEYYYDETTYNCSIHFDGLNSLPAYKNTSLFFLFFNLILLFAEGYFVSCVLVYIFDNIKKGSNSSRRTAASARRSSR